MIYLYGKPGCRLCEAAEEKMRLMHISYEKRDLFDVDAWRQDEWNYTEAMARHADSGSLPIFVIGRAAMTYPEAMRHLREDGRRLQTAATPTPLT